MHQENAMLKKKTYEILWNFETQTVHPIQTRRPNRRGKIKGSEKLDKHLDLA